MVRRHLAPHAVVLRCRMILMLADGLGPSAIGRQLGVSDRVVRKWRIRWEKRPVLPAMRDADRPGRSASIALETRCQLVQVACERPPDERGVRRPVWTQRALVGALYARAGVRISRSSVQRILCSKGLRPHRVRYWLQSPDPDFARKVRQICRLYLEPPPDAVVVCIDEKPMQALGRRSPDRRDRDGSVRHEFEYVRRGVCHLLGAFDVRTGRVLGRVVKKRSAAALHNFLEAVARAFPERRVFIVWDNLNLHHDGKDRDWGEFSRHHGGRFRFVHTPLHASWMNQIEVWFSILQRRLLRYGSFQSIADLREQVLAFIRFWNRFEAHPFRWKFSGQFVQRPTIPLAA
jgi:transposase